MADETAPMPGANRDDNSGQYVETYPDEDFLAALDAEDGMASTQEIADHVGCAYETAYKKLRDLEDEGAVSSRKVANARLWKLVDGDDDAEDDQ